MPRARVIDTLSSRHTRLSGGGDVGDYSDGGCG